VLKDLDKIALGGGCHWCTEAVFQHLKGVVNVEQGYVCSIEENSTFSEAVIVHFNPSTISLDQLIEIHLYTHQSTSNHSFRSKYRSAIYYFEELQKNHAENILIKLQSDFSKSIITKVLKFADFQSSREEIQDYYTKDPKKPFCQLYIEPKLKILMEQFNDNVNISKT